MNNGTTPSTRKIEKSLTCGLVSSFIYILRHSILFMFSFLPIDLGVNKKLDEISSPIERAELLSTLNSACGLVIGTGCGLFNGALLMLISGYLTDTQSNAFYWTGCLAALLAIVITRNGLRIRKIAKNTAS